MVASRDGGAVSRGGRRRISPAAAGHSLFLVSRESRAVQTVVGRRSRVGQSIASSLWSLAYIVRLFVNSLSRSLESSRNYFRRCSSFSREFSRESSREFSREFTREYLSRILSHVRSCISLVHSLSHSLVNISREYIREFSYGFARGSSLGFSRECLFLTLSLTKLVRLTVLRERLNSPSRHIRVN